MVLLGIAVPMFFLGWWSYDKEAAEDFFLFNKNHLLLTAAAAWVWVAMYELTTWAISSLKGKKSKE